MGREPDHAAYLAEMIAFIKRRGKKLWTEDLRNEYNAIWEKYYGPMTPRGGGNAGQGNADWKGHE